MPEDPHQLERFLVAQEGIYDQALAELRREKKRTHWIWYVFPQLDGLGSSPTARFYAIKSADEAKAYLLHPVLAPRLIECAEALLAIQGKTVPIHFSVSVFSISAFTSPPSSQPSPNRTRSSPASSTSTSTAILTKRPSICWKSSSSHFSGSQNFSLSAFSSPSPRKNDFIKTQRKSQHSHGVTHLSSSQ
jgi:hypothetical protein